MRMRSTVLSLCLPLLAACRGDDGPDTTSDGASSTTAVATETTLAPDTDTETAGAIPGCECIVDEDPTDPTTTPSRPTCGESLCPQVAGSCEGYCFDDAPFVLEDPAALECALVALRDRTPGIVTWSWMEGGGQNDDSGYVLIDAHGTALRRDWSWSDFDYSVTDAVLGQLPPAEHFDGCLIEPDDLTRFNCLRGGLDSMLAVCDEGWFYTDF